MATNLKLIIGLSGAGKSTVLHVFEDLHYFTADGVPPSLLYEMLVLLQDVHDSIALGLNQKSPTFIQDLHTALQQIKKLALTTEIIFIEADQKIITRRYATTRRPHPLEKPGRGLSAAIDKELQILSEIRSQAHLIINTSSFSVHDLRRNIQERYGLLKAKEHSLNINLISFGFKYGIPMEVDLVFDLRFLPNPYFEEHLSAFTGENQAVAEYIFSTSQAKEFKQKLIDFINYVLPLYEDEGRYRLSIALGCTGGKHRSVAMTLALQAALLKQNYTVSIEHKHMNLE